MYPPTSVNALASQCQNLHILMPANRGVAGHMTKLAILSPRGSLDDCFAR